MTVDVALPVQTHTIAGIGPYGTGWPYVEASLLVGIAADDGSIDFLTAPDFSVTPASSATAGDVFLAPAVAAANAGRPLYIERATNEEQGWVGNLSAREKGLETQLDLIVMAAQERRGAVDRSLRATVPLAPFEPGDTGSTLIRTAGGYGPGPTADQIAGAQMAATTATAAATRAEAAAATLPLHVATFADLSGILPDALAVGDRVSVLSLGGAMYQRVSSGGHLDYSGTGGVRLNAVPQNGTLTLRQFGPAADGATDDGGVIATWLQACVDMDAKGYAEAGTYSIGHVRIRTINAPLTIECHPEAQFIGRATNDAVAGTGSNTSAVATFAAGALGYGVSYVNGAGVEVAWTEGTQYTVTGTTINWNAGSAPHGPLAIGHTVRIWSRNPIIELGAATAFSHRIEWRGGKVNNSLRGYFSADASGSGLMLSDLDSYLIDGLIVQGAADYLTAIANKVTDSAIVIQRCNSGEIRGGMQIGQADLGIYITGGALAANTDDSVGHVITGSTARLCKQGHSAKRDAVGVRMVGNLYDRCDVGASLYPTTVDLAAGEGLINSNTFVRCGRPVDVRRSKGAVVTGNTIKDFGYEPDGVTPVASPLGINMQGTVGGLITGNLIYYDELSSPATAVGIRINLDTTGTTIQPQDCKITNNTMTGVAIACREGGSGTGNVWDNHINGATTFMDVVGNRFWRYSRGGNTVVEGYGSTLHEGAFTPTIILAGASGSPTISHTARQIGHSLRIGNLVVVTVSVEATITHTETTAQLRVTGLPQTSKATANIVASGQVTTHIGVNYLASTTTLIAEVPNNTAYARFQSEGSGAVGGIITAAQIPSGGTVRLDFTICYHAEPLVTN